MMKTPHSLQIMHESKQNELIPIRDWCNWNGIGHYPMHTASSVIKRGDVTLLELYIKRDFLCKKNCLNWKATFEIRAVC